MDQSIDGRREVFSIAEVAHAAGVTPARTRALLAEGGIPTIDGEFMTWSTAVDVVDCLTSQESTLSTELEGHVALGRTPFALIPSAKRPTFMSLVVSSTLHVVLVVGIVLITSVGLASREPQDHELYEETPVSLVFLMTPGPGGGGGGGGLKQPTPPPPAEREGPEVVSSPLPAREPPDPVDPPPEPIAEREPPVLEHEPLPPIIAPVVAAPADTRDIAGVIDAEETGATDESRGPGDDGGVGAGQGTGLGQGAGAGIGPGSGGGTGGGPYRPGSGIEPPALLHEVKAEYTEEARRRGLEGEVVLEIVILRDGSVGDVRVLRRLGLGLDERAIQAIRGWRFRPARRMGTPVDVLVEVEVDFRLR